MLKKRIIPSLLLKDGRMVKSRQFGQYRDTGYPLTAARIYNAQRADELMVLDISASTEGRSTLFEVIEQIADECFMPLCVGGGIRTLEDIRQILKGGADKVSMCTAAVEEEGLIEKAAERFGSSTIVIAIDVKESDGRKEVYIRGGRTPTGKDPVEWAKSVEEKGAGEIYLMSIDRDGTMHGLDIPLIESVAHAVCIPVIAAGGVGHLEDFKKGFDAGASAVSAASIFHFTDQSVIKTRKYLVNNGVNVRP
ncbi:imidazole glycerol phosphate synthase subunit HisF [Candidatus Peregrinibacteria bacterium]|nr:imidazole glycerol phosphate synthase subunit HisF [Candidatus Peregrinibacteria bacterium]